MKKKSKRKCGLVIGYVGTAYRGLQINRELSGGPKTIEEVLEEALYKAGCISEANYGNLDKISWNRSSRTDKGVHAARVVVGGKLEVDLAAFDADTLLSRAVVDEVNKYLPDDIQVFSCAKVPGAFRPREACSYREYEYWLPLGYLGKEETVALRRLEAFRRAIRSYEGTHSFHNFQASKSKEMRKKKQALRAAKDELAAAQAAWEGGDGADEKEEGENLEEGMESVLEERMIMKEMSCNMLSCTTDDPIELEGQKFVRVFIRGQSFLYNQIRLMVGGAIATATEVLPETAFWMALNSPYLVPIPVAPATGLVLVNQAFARYANAVLMDAAGVSQALGPRAALDRANPTLRTQVLLDAGALAASRRFEEERIRPEVARAWAREGAREEWAAYLAHPRFAPGAAARAALEAARPAVEEARARDRQEKDERDMRRRLFRLEKGDFDSDSYRELMPNQFATDLCCNFGLVPGRRVADIQRALVDALIAGEVAREATREDLLRFVAEVGVDELSLRPHQHYDEGAVQPQKKKPGKAGGSM